MRRVFNHTARTPAGRRQNLISCGKAPRSDQARSPAQLSSGESLLRDFGRSLLFVGISCFYWITMTPFTDLSVDPATAKPAWWTAALTVGIFLALLVYVANSPFRAAIARPRLLLIALFGWLLITAALAVDPMDAVRRVVITITICISASTLPMLPRDEAHFARLMAIVMGIVLGICYLGVVLLPTLAIHQPSDFAEGLHAGLWRGVYIQKNITAQAMVIAALIGVYLMKSWSRPWGLVITLAAVVFLIKTGSKTSIAEFPLVLGLSIIFERWRLLRLPIAFGSVALLNLVTVGAVMLPAVHDLIALTGIDATFTGRGDIWKLAFGAIADKPLTGHGYDSFWQSEALIHSEDAIFTWAVHADHAHNAYVDSAVTAGIPGLLLMLALVLVMPFRDLAAADARGGFTPLTRLFLRIWLFGILVACLESVFLANTGPTWFMILVAIFGLRYQARYAHSHASAPVPGTRPAFA